MLRFLVGGCIALLLALALAGGFMWGNNGFLLVVATIAVSIALVELHKATQNTFEKAFGFKSNPSEVTWAQFQIDQILKTKATIYDQAVKRLRDEDARPRFSDARSEILAGHRIRSELVKEVNRTGKDLEQAKRLAETWQTKNKSTPLTREPKVEGQNRHENEGLTTS